MKCELTGKIDDIPDSWTMEQAKGGIPYYHGEYEKYWQNGGGDPLHPTVTGGPCKGGCPSHLGVSQNETSARPLPDTQVASKAMDALEALAKRDNPFFLAVGIHKPVRAWQLTPNFQPLVPLPFVRRQLQPVFRLEAEARARSQRSRA